MLKLLQNNLRVCKAVHDFMRRTILEKNADVVITSDQYRNDTEKNSWFAVSDGEEVIYVDSNTTADEIKSKELGFHWVAISCIGVSNCY